MLPRIVVLHRCPDTCETCRFWQPDEDFEDNVIGECGLKAPAFNAPLPKPSGANAVNALPRRPWPMTESRDWCAEWQRGCAA